MKNLFLLALMFSVPYWSFGQRKIKKLEVNEIGVNVNLSFQPVNDEVSFKGLDIKITPISTDDLNSKLLTESGLNGKYQYSFYESDRRSYFLRKNPFPLKQMRKYRLTKSLTQTFSYHINWKPEQNEEPKADSTKPANDSKRTLTTVHKKSPITFQ